MNINQIHYFLAIVKTRSFSEAAYDLFISQSSISKQIKSLEDELGIILFQRSSNQRTLTPAGQVFYKYAKTMYENHKEMLEELDLLKNSLSTTLRIGNIPVTTMYTSFNVGVEMARFQYAYKDANINFETYEASQLEITKEISGNFSDFALVREERIPNPEDFDTILFSLDELVLVCNKEHPLAKLKKASLKQIASYPAFLLGKEAELNGIIKTAFQNEGLKLKQHGESLKPKIIQGMLSEGEDISLLPKNLVDLNSFSKLKTIPLEKPLTSRLVMIRSKNRKANSLTQAFWEFTKERCEKRQDV